MSLCEGEATRRLPIVPEFIHPQTRFRVEYWKAAVRLCGVTTRIVGPTGGLPGYRAAHYEDLVAEYGADVLASWIPTNYKS